MTDTKKNGKSAEKPILMTHQAYNMLINDLHLKPEDILAKPLKSKERIKSPKTNRFIRIHCIAYQKLLEEGYKDEDLLLRREGYILSPDSNKLIKVFGKTFNQLLKKGDKDPRFDLNNMLRLERMKYGDTIAGINHNKKKITKKEVDELIKNSSSVVVFTNATFYQADAEQHYDGFYACGCLFNNQKMTSFYDAKEYRIDTNELSYQYQKRVFEEINNIDALFTYLSNDNEESLQNLSIHNVDILSLYFLYKDVNMILNIIDKKVKKALSTPSYFKLIKYHLWFKCHINLFNLGSKEVKIKINLIEDDNVDYESFETVKQSKEKLVKEIKAWSVDMIDYVKEHCK